jgi:hypothetical protein
VKKCTSCAKDLPDSAHHCVFCGAKQAPAPVPGAAAQQAKTVLGYQAADVIKEMQRQGVSAPPRPGAGSSPPPPAPIGTAPTMARPGGPTPMTPMQPMPQPPAPNYPPPPPDAVPASQARTVFIPGGAGPGPMPVQSAPIPVPQHHAPSAPVQMPMSSAPSAPVVMPSYQPPSAPMQMPNYPPPPAPMGMHGGYPPSPGVPAPIAHAPSGPAAPPPYLASQTALRASRPVEPFSDGLKLVLLSFGILLLGAFATPLSTQPAMVFHWNVILDAPGIAKLLSLMLVTGGVLALVIALTPLQAVPRGAIAAGLGLFMAATPYIIAGTAQWQEVVRLVGLICLVGGLLVRHEYREAQLGRILATIGAAAVLMVYLIPVGGGDPPLINLFRAIADVPLPEYKIAAIIDLLPAILAIVSLLVWLPAPSSAGAKVLAWIWIVYPAVAVVAAVVIKSGGDIAGVIKASPFGALMAWVSGAAAAAFVGYGVATVAGKQLE